jgi:flagellar basal body-associated protein FliL
MHNSASKVKVIIVIIIITVIIVIAVIKMFWFILNSYPGDTGSGLQVSPNSRGFIGPATIRKGTPQVGSFNGAREEEEEEAQDKLRDYCY